MSDAFKSALSTHDSESITVRTKDLSSEVMGEMGFGDGVYYLLTGEDPTPAESKLFNAMLVSLMVHGKTPHAIAARLTYLAEPTSIQGAVASGILGVGSQLVGPMEQCARELQSVNDAEDSTAAVRAVVADYRDRGEPFPGIGHPHLEPQDPRAQRLLSLAESSDIDMIHVDLLREIRLEFEDQLNKSLPINVTGAIGAVCSDMGLSPEGARGIAVISRAAGLVGEVLEEQSSPMAMDIWQLIDEKVEFDPDNF